MRSLPFSRVRPPKGKGIAGLVILACAAFLGYKYNLSAHETVNVDVPLFQQFNPCFVVMLTPVSMALFGWLASKHKEPSAPRKIGFGMLVAGLGYVIMILASIGLEAIMLPAIPLTTHSVSVRCGLCAPISC